MVFKWKDDHTPLILNLMKDRQCLWNTKAEEYKSKTCRERALQEIVQELNIEGVTVEDVKLKIKTIRTRYSSELAKVNESSKSGAGSDDLYIPKLFWFKLADSFLNAVCVPRSSTAATIQKRKTIPTLQTEDIEDTHSEEYITQVEETSPAVASASDEVRKRARTENAHTYWKTPSSKKRSFSGISDVERAIHKLSSIAAQNSVTETDDEFDHFCRSLTTQPKHMPLDRALLCQERLQKVMTEERMYLFRLQNGGKNVSQYMSHWNHSPSPNSEMSNQTTSYGINSYTATPIASPSFTHFQSLNTDTLDSATSASQEGYTGQPSQDILSQALSSITYQ